MYILGINTAVMCKGLNVERLTTGCNITGGCRIMKKKKQTNYVLKMKLHFEKTLFESVLFLSFEHLTTFHRLILNFLMI